MISFKALYSIVSLATILVAPFTYAETPTTVARVYELKGNAFYKIGDQMNFLANQMEIPSGAEIFTELDSSLSLYDYHNNLFQMAGGTQLSFSSKSVELRDGHLWIKRKNFDNARPLVISTSNANVDVGVSEGIVSFNVTNGKTQVLSMQGDFVLKNKLNSLYAMDIGSGEFSFLHNDENEGRPRKPTPVGPESYKKITGLFPHSSATKPKSNLAATSVQTQPTHQVVKTDDLFEQALAEKRGQKPSNAIPVVSKTGVAIEMYNKIIQSENTSGRGRGIASVKTTNKVPLKRSEVEVKIFGAKKVHQSRGPSSVSRPEVDYKYIDKKEHKGTMRVPASVKTIPLKSGRSAFDREMKKQYNTQTRHTPELNGLIDELRSVDMDYKKEY